MDVDQAVKNAKGGEVQFKVEKAGVIHGGVGKAVFERGKLVENVKAFVPAVNRAKPAGAKGTYLKKIALVLDHGPGRIGRYRQRGRRMTEFAPGRPRDVHGRSDRPDCPRRWVPDGA